MSQETGLSTPENGQVSPNLMPLTKKSLELKDLKTALEDIGKQDGCPALTPNSLAATEKPMSMASDASVCGSDDTTPAPDSAFSHLAQMATVDGPATYDASMMSESLILVNSANTIGSMGMSTDSSFDHVSRVNTGDSVDKATDESKGTMTVGNTVSKTSGFKHKVRKSLEWLSGSHSDCSDAA